MHKIIYLIVRGDTKKEAWGKREYIRDYLCSEKNNLSYDYGTFFNEKSQVSGASRWGPLPSIAKLSSKEGKFLLNRGLATIRNEFLTDLKEVKKVIEEYTDEEIYDEKVTDPKSLILESLKDKTFDSSHRLHMFRYYLGQMSDEMRNGWIYFLDDNDNDKFIHGFKGHLNFEEEMQIEDKTKLWIMPMDVHY